MKPKFLIASLLSIYLFVPVIRADHLPLKDQAKGEPEQMLALVILGRTRVSDVIKLYGKPSELSKEPNPPDLKVVDTYHYYWTKGSTKLHLLVYGGAEVKGNEYIAMIEVEGSPSSGQLVRTGRGLKLGDSLRDVRRIYGPRYKVRNIPSLNIHDVMIQWRKAEFSLVAELDAKGRIKKMSLFAPE
jgi:hypothetical protein